MKGGRNEPTCIQSGLLFTSFHIASFLMRFPSLSRASPLPSPRLPPSPSQVLLTEKQVRGCGDDDKVYVCRERKGDIVYGVLFTRSIGDYDAHQNLGVESKPEVR